MNETTLVILAAGIGSRYGGLKQMDPAGPGRQTLIDYSVYDAGEAGFRRIVVVLKEEMLEDFKKRISSRWPLRFDVHYAFQDLDQLPPDAGDFPSRRKPWGTGHALLAAAEYLDRPFAAINADDFYGREAFLKLHEFLQNVPPRSMEFAMVGFRLAGTLSGHGSVSRGLCQTAADGYLQSVREITAIEPQNGGGRYRDDDGSQRLLSGRELVSLNCWGFTPALLARLNELFARFLKRIQGSQLADSAEFFLPDAINEMLATREARVKVLESSQRWLGITHQKDLARVKRGISERIEAGEYPEILWGRGNAPEC